MILTTCSQTAGGVIFVQHTSYVAIRWRFLCARQHTRSLQFTGVWPVDWLPAPLAHSRQHHVPIISFVLFQMSPFLHIAFRAAV